jgi:inner membrane protein
MMARSHIIVALAAWFISAPSLHVMSFEPVSLGFVVVGAVLPDVDHPKSWVGRRTRPLSTFLASVLGHRGITHSAIAIFALASWLFYVGHYRAWVCGLVVGYLSHLAADMFTPRGLRLAWPLRRIYSLPLYRTGSQGEYTIVNLVLFGTIVWELHRSISANLLWR